MSRRLFLNYRRVDAAATAGRLFDLLAQRFGHDSVFMDVDKIPSAVEFEKFIIEQLGQCDVLLCLIGPTWLLASDGNGNKRLHDPNDYVAMEIAQARALRKPVLPILIDGASMPSAADLPDPIKYLSGLNACHLRNAQFGRDAQLIISTLVEQFRLRPPSRFAIAVGEIFRGIFPRGADLRPKTEISPNKTRTRPSFQFDPRTRAKRISDAENSLSRLQAKMDYELLVSTASGFIESGVASADICEMHANGLHELGELEAAVEACADSLKSYPQHQRLLYLRAIALRDLQRYEEAIEDIKILLSVNSVDHDAWHLLGMLRDDTKRYKDAIEAYSKAINLSPDLQPAHYHLGVAFENLGLYSDARKHYEKAATLDPEDADPMAALERLQKARLN